MPSQPSTSLDDVIGNMKDTLKAIRNDVNHKTLKDLNREMTPFDLPALSPVPQVQEYIEKQLNHDGDDGRVVGMQYIVSEGCGEKAVDVQCWRGDEEGQD